jgi:hypothetical protein
MSPTIYPDPRPTPPPAAPPEPDILPEEVNDDPTYESPFDRRKPAADEEGAVTYRGATSDPIFGYLIGLALCLGLTPLIPAQTDLRYTLVWGVLAGFGVLSWLMGSSARIWTETPENLFWGVIFGLVVGVPLLMFGGDILRQTDQRLFAGLSAGGVLAFLIFVMPLAETLFFRGILQEVRPFWQVGLLATLWSALLFFPVMDVMRFPAVAVVIGTALGLMNMIYSYVRQRNGLAAAWLCQIVVNVVVLFLPVLIA